MNKKVLRTKEVSWDGRENSITIDVPPFGICIFNSTPKQHS